MFLHIDEIENYISTPTFHNICHFTNTFLPTLFRSSNVFTREIS
jgi:hypothetical protein